MGREQSQGAGCFPRASPTHSQGALVVSRSKSGGSWVPHFHLKMEDIIWDQVPGSVREVGLWGPSGGRRTQVSGLGL